MDLTLITTLDIIVLLEDIDAASDLVRSRDEIDDDNENKLNISTKNKTNVLMENAEPLNQELIQKIFNTPLDGTTYGNINDKNLFLFAKIENISENDSLKKDEKIPNLIKQINNDYLSLMQAIFSDNILSNVKVSINEEMIDNLLKN